MELTDFMSRIDQELEGSDREGFEEFDQGIIQAAAYSLWLDGSRTPDLDALRSRVDLFEGYCCDESSLANSEKDTQTFMDKADDMKLGAFILDVLNKGVAQHLIERRRAAGGRVVELRNEESKFFVTPQDEGFYLFTA